MAGKWSEYAGSDAGGEDYALHERHVAAEELSEALLDAVALLDNRDRGFDPTVSHADIRRQVVARADAAIARFREVRG